MCDSNRYHAHVQNASTAPERGHVALFEPFTERCDSLCGVAAETAAETVPIQTASEKAYKNQMCDGARYRTVHA